MTFALLDQHEKLRSRFPWNTRRFLLPVLYSREYFFPLAYLSPPETQGTRRIRTERFFRERLSFNKSSYLLYPLAFKCAKGSYASPGCGEM